MSDMVEVVIDSIRVSLMSQQRIVILRDTNADRYLPIWIGVYEAEAITIALQEVEVARPLTHDLLKSIFSTLNARIIRVEVPSMRDDTYYGNIVVEHNDRIINVDARPSDALNLAVRAHVPILVAREVMDAAGIRPEEDLKEGAPFESPAPDKSSDSSPAAKHSPSEEGEDRLSIFEDFLEKLDLDEDEDQGPEKTDEE